MKTFQRLSSSLSNQIKELGVKVSSKDVWGKGSLNDTTDKNSGEFFSSQILGTASAGEVLFETSCLFHDLVLQIEDAIIHLLLEHFNLEDLPQASSVFASRAAQFGGFDQTDSVYCTSQIGVIRSSIRRMACHDRTQLSEHLDAIFVGISSCCDKNISIQSLPDPLLRSLVSQLSGVESTDKQMSYLLLFDESFTSTIHLKMTAVNHVDDGQNPKCLEILRECNSTVSVIVAGSGSEQVHGVFTQVQAANLNSSSTSSPSPLYSSSEGYLLSRKEKIIALSSIVDDIVDNSPQLNSEDSPCGLNARELIMSAEDTNHGGKGKSDLIVYQWILSNPSVASRYYTCCTVDPSPLPPALGWRPSGLCQGKLPGPHIIMRNSADLDSDESGSDDATVDNPILSEASTDATLPLKNKIEKSDRRKKREKYRKCATDPVAAPMLTPESFSTRSLNIATIRRTHHSAGSIPSNGKILKRRVVPTSGTICISPAGEEIHSPYIHIQREIISDDEIELLSSVGNVTISECCLLKTGWNGTGTGTGTEIENGSEMKDNDDICRKQLLELVNDCKATEILHDSSITRIKDRIAWLSSVTDTDELLSGSEFAIVDPQEEDQIKINDDNIEYFESQWNLEEILRTKSLTVSIAEPAGLAKSLVESISAGIKERRTVGGKDQICSLDGLSTACVKKVTSMPTMPSSIGAERVKRISHHRRSQSQSQSVYQWPVDCTSYLSDNDSEENYHNDVDSTSTAPHQTGPNILNRNLQSIYGDLPQKLSHNHRLLLPNTDEPKSDKKALRRRGVGVGEVATGRDRALSPTISNINDARGFKSAGGRTSRYLSELRDLFSPLHHQSYSYAEVDVIGVELRGSSRWSSSCSGSPPVHPAEKVHYVIRLSLRECTTPDISPTVTATATATATSTQKDSRSKVPATADIADVDKQSRDDYPKLSDTTSKHSEENGEESPTNSQYFSYSSLLPFELPAILAVETDSKDDLLPGSQLRLTAGVQSQQSYSRRVFTVKRDLAALSLFHAQLSDLLLLHPRRDISPPPFPDPFLVAIVEEELIGSAENKSVNSFSMKMMQTKLESENFAYSSSMRDQCQYSRGKESLRSKGLDGVLESIQEYLRGIFALVQLIDEVTLACKDSNVLLGDGDGDGDGSGNGNGETEGEDEGDVSDCSLLLKLGSLVGSFLSNKGKEENIFTSAPVPATPSVQQETVIPSLMDTLADFALLPVSTSSALLSLISGGTSPSPKSSTSVPQSEKADDGRRISGACWQPYVRGGLKTRLTFHDDQGGRLSLKSDDELLRTQKSRCMGCGKPLSAQWGFLGLDRNYQPCRYYGGLFCRKWCHADDRRLIPNRLLLYWDHKAHRVSIQAAKFLDDLWNKPFIHLSTANPLLYEGVPTLRLARNMRGRVVQLIERVLESGSCDEISVVKDAIVNTLGVNQVHLCLSQEIYSLSDLMCVQTGEVLAVLELLINVLRDMDHTLGVQSGPTHRQPCSPSGS